MSTVTVCFSFGIELDLGESHQALGRLAGCVGQRGVDFGDLGAFARARVGQGEGHLHCVSGRDLQARVTVGGVGEAEAEGEQHGLLLRVIPLVANLDAFVVGDLEGRQSLGPVSWRHCAGEVRGLRGRHGDGGMRQVGFALGEGVGQLAAGVHAAEEHVAEGVGAIAAAEPGFENCGGLVDPRHGDWIARFKHDDGVRIGGSHGGDDRVLIMGQA